MKQELDRRFKSQFHYALWELILPIIIVILFIISSSMLTASLLNSNLDIKFSDIIANWPDSIRNVEFPFVIAAGVTAIIAVLLLIPLLIIWILGIVNAVKINVITHDSIVLIVFSVVPIYFIHLIFAIIERNKFRNYAPITRAPSTNNYMQQTLKEQHLKNAFIDEIISSTEYENKLKKLKNKKIIYNAN